jgi:hypothetical protein
LEGRGDEELFSEEPGKLEIEHSWEIFCRYLACDLVVTGMTGKSDGT